MRIDHKTFRKGMEYVYLAILGFIGFSRMSQYVIHSILGIPFYLIEIFFVPFFIYTWPEYLILLKRVSKKRWFVVFLFVLIYDVLMGCAYTFEIVDTVTMSRSLIYIVLLSFLFYEKNDYSIDKLYIISFFGLLGELIYSTLFSTADINSINTSCMALMMIIPAVKRRYGLFMISSILALIISINSGYRLGIVILLLVVMEVVVWTVVVSEKRTVKSLTRKMSIPIAFLAVILMVVANYERFVELISSLFGTSQYAIYRVTNRLIGLFTMDFSLSREQARFDAFDVIVEWFDDRLLPRGLVGKSVGTLSYYFDVPITYLYDAFGSILTIVILGCCLFKGFKCFLASLKDTVKDSHVVAGLMFPVLAMCMIVNGSFLYITFQCITTGIIIGIWFSNAREKKE